MGFDYNKHKEGGGDSMWTSYSDLFLGLSIIFLLLYVSASLRQGTDGVRQALENKQLTKRVKELESILQQEETKAQNYLKNQANADEQENYKELMEKLDLLQEEASEEKNKLRQAAMDNEKKERALNKYQQMIRQIVNTNINAKVKIKSRDTFIEKQDEIITEKTEQITDLEKTVAEKQQAIQQGENRIDQLEDTLDNRVKQLQAAYRAQKITKQKMLQQQDAIKRETEAKVAALREQNERAQAEIDRAKGELAQTESKLGEAEAQAQKLAGEKERLAGEKARLAGQLAGLSDKHRGELEGLKGQFEKQAAAERAAFEGQLAKERLSGAEKAAREAAFRADAERKARDMEGKLGDLAGKYRATQGELAKAQENLMAKKKLADKIKQSFKQVGVDADVDANTGDVMLNFNGQYFESGSSQLKPGMRKLLEQAMPAYSASLLGDPKVAEKIQSVEIVGFASPTYKGKFVDPTSLEPSDRQAVNYNLDLSYGRARSIFNHVFDKNKMAFKHQQQLLPLVKVTGRSFLATDKQREPAAGGNATGESFCRQNDCAKLQRVIIKFNLKD